MAIKRSLVLALVLVALDLFVFVQIGSHDFVTIDDSPYVTANAVVQNGLEWRGVVWAFTTTQSANWHPVTWLSHMFDVELFGMNAGAHHLVNLVFHIINTLLVFLVLVRLTGSEWRSAFVAALFGVHPLHVESVAWIAERKDVLSTMFCWLTIWAYATYARTRKPRHYAATIGLFVLGLLAKPMLVTLPFLLLLIDVWPLRRFTRAAVRTVLLEKLPLIGLTVVSSLITFLAQRGGGAVAGLSRLPIDARVENALVSYVAYLGKTFWPVELSVFYPFPSSIPPAAWVGAATLLAVISAATLLAGRRFPYMPVGWFWYLGTLVPVIGLVQVGNQGMADRYSYLPLVGIFIAVVWGGADLLKLAGVTFARMRAPLVTAGAMVVVMLAVMAKAQAAYWNNDLDLWRHAVAVVPDSGLAHANLGGILGKTGRWTEALAEFQEALRLNANVPLGQDSVAVAHHEMGLALAAQGRPTDAAAEYRQALAIKPGFALAHHDLGLALFQMGRMPAAVAEFTETIRLEPSLGSAWNNRGLALASQGRIAEALDDFTKAVELAPDLEAAHLDRALALRQVGRLNEARAEFQEVLRIDPGNETAARALTVMTPAGD